MMGFGPTEGKALTYWEYTAMLSTWNDRHSDGKDKFDPTAAPDPDLVEMMKGMVH